MFKSKRIGVIIAAAGSGNRMGNGFPKQFMTIDGIPMLQKTVNVFCENRYVDSICIVSNADYMEKCCSIFGFLWDGKNKTGDAIEKKYNKIKCIVKGGTQRQDSVSTGLNMLELYDPCFDYVMIHDAARPYITDKMIEDSLQMVEKCGACITAVPVKDTIKQGSLTLERDNLYNVQTPQTFKREIIKQAYQRAYSDGYYGTDDGSLVERMGIYVGFVPGDYNNIKITTREDLPMETRIGTGYDVHRLTEGRKLVLGGTEIEFDRGLLGHSDADVLTHAVMDALLGAAAKGDIGKHFPDNDHQYKDISSILLLAKVGELIGAEGYKISNIDVTVMCQRPKLAPHIESMCKNLAEGLKLPQSVVSIKATTTEGLGFVGREEGIAAQAVCILTK